MVWKHTHSVEYWSAIYSANEKLIPTWLLSEHEHLRFYIRFICTYSKHYEEIKYLWPWFGFANHLILIVCFISYEIEVG
jgi:hypothetical protein